MSEKRSWSAASPAISSVGSRVITSYRRVLLKIGGEIFAGPQTKAVLDRHVFEALTREIKDIQMAGVQLGIVIGGGNIWRGITSADYGIERATGDYMGMLATVFNALALQSALERNDVNTRVQSALEITKVAEPYIRRRAIRHLEKGRVVIFAAGTGNPFFSTDTAAALRAVEIKAEILLKGTKVDGVYDKDPAKHKGAKKYKEITFLEMIKKDLKVIDSTAITMCMQNKIPIIVFDIKDKDAVKKILKGEKIGTLIWG